MREPGWSPCWFRPLALSFGGRVASRVEGEGALARAAGERGKVFVFSSAARIASFGAEPAGGLHMRWGAVSRGWRRPLEREYAVYRIVSYRIVLASSTCHSEVARREGSVEVE
jgi:hypothetical protein